MIKAPPAAPAPGDPAARCRAVTEAADPDPAAAPRRAADAPSDYACRVPIEGCSMLIRLPSVSVNETYWPTPGISIGSPSTLPPASCTFFIDFLMSSTATTTDGC